MGQKLQNWGGGGGNCVELTNKYSEVNIIIIHEISMVSAK